MWLTPNEEQALQLLMRAYLTAARKSHPPLMAPSFSFLPACLPAKRPCSALMAAFVIVPGKLMLACVPGTGWVVQTGFPSGPSHRRDGFFAAPAAQVQCELNMLSGFPKAEKCHYWLPGSNQKFSSNFERFWCAFLFGGYIKVQGRKAALIAGG